MKKRKFLLILLYFLTFISFIITIIGILAVVTYSSFRQDYSNPEDYTTQSIIIGSIFSDDESVSISDDLEGAYYIYGSNYDVVMNTNMMNELNIGDSINITYGPKGFGDSFEHPIVMIEKSGTVYLDYDTGFTNWVNDHKVSLFPAILVIAIPAVFTGLLIMNIRIIKKRTNQ